jgi:hypothetical protein
MDEGLLALFEYIKQDFLSLSLVDFTIKANKDGSALDVGPAITSTALSSEWSPYWSARVAATRESFPLKSREEAYTKLKYLVDEIIAKLKSGSVSRPRKRIVEEVVNKISDPKIKQICLEINTTPDQNVLSLGESLGEAIKWTLWYRAQQIPGAVQALGNDRELANLLDKAISKNLRYYPDPSERAAHRFVEEYKNNFYKAAYDMIRHDQSYIPDIVVLNPAIDALEHILKATFP